MALDLFGKEIIEDVLLRDKFIEPPFSVLDTKSGSWQNRKNAWKQKGIKSEIGRDVVTYAGATHNDFMAQRMNKVGDNASIFDPALCELIYKWFCADNGHILDPFAGGSVRGIVANYLGFKYTGIDIRQQQIDSNREQSLDILPIDNQPNYYVGDSNEQLDGFNKQFDFVFSCPPYFNLEVYSDLKNDISNMDYKDFMIAYKSIIKKSCNLLKIGCYACFVVAEIRDKNGNYIGFVPDTIRAFQECNMKFYNEAILLNSYGTAMLRADKQFTSGKKLVKVHQNVLIFKKV